MSIDRKTVRALSTHSLIENALNVFLARKVSSRSHTVFNVTVVQRDPFTNEVITG